MQISNSKHHSSEVEKSKKPIVIDSKKIYTSSSPKKVNEINLLYVKVIEWFFKIRQSQLRILEEKGKILNYFSDTLWHVLFTNFFVVNSLRS